MSNPSWSSVLRRLRPWVVGWFTVRLGQFRLTQGQPQSFRSSAAAERAFCGACGTPLTFRRDGQDEIDVTVCSLDDAEAVAPQDHTFVRSRLSWVEWAEALPRYATTRDAGPPLSELGAFGVRLASLSLRA